MSAASLLAWCLTACALHPPAREPLCRAVLSSWNPQTLEVRAILESPDGYALKGRVVSVVTPDSHTVPLVFDPAQCAYSGRITAPARGVYSIRFDGPSSPGQVLRVPLTPLASTPEVNLAVDSEGNSASAGQTLNPADAIRLGWTSCPGASVYRVTITKSHTTVFAATTTEPGILLDPQALATASGELAVRVVARALAGDPQLTDTPYWSVAESQGAAFPLTVRFSGSDKSF